MKPVVAWECRYCGTVVKWKSSMYRHEKQCNQNPQKRSCRTCRYLTKETEDTAGWNEPPAIVFTWACRAGAYRDEVYNPVTGEGFLRNGMCPDWKIKRYDTKEQAEKCCGEGG